MSESLIVMAVMGPVGRSTSRGCAPKTAWSIPKRLLARRNSESPMRLVRVRDRGMARVRVWVWIRVRVWVWGER